MRQKAPPCPCGREHYSKGFCVKCYQKEYRKNPENREKQNAYQREHRKIPEVRKKHNEYMKKYYKRPEVMKRISAYMIEYHKRPEVIARSKKYYQTYYERKEEDFQKAFEVSTKTVTSDGMNVSTGRVIARKNFHDSKQQCIKTLILYKTTDCFNPYRLQVIDIAKSHEQWFFLSKPPKMFGGIEEPKPEETEEKDIRIKFSHIYPKMPEFIRKGDDGNTWLVGVAVIDDLDDLPEEFLHYDTVYFDEKTGEGRNYPLERGKSLILLLFSQKPEMLWATIRRFTPEKEKYYRNLVGGEVDIIINKKAFGDKNAKPAVKESDLQDAQKKEV
jgi:hypothetical protein